MFDVRRIQESGTYIWRGRDMLMFFDMSEFKSLIDIPHHVRRWACDADESVYRDLAPQESLLSFTPLPNLKQPFSSVKKRLIGVNFLQTRSTLHHLGVLTRDIFPSKTTMNESPTSHAPSLSMTLHRSRRTTYRGTGVLFFRSLRLGLRSYPLFWRRLGRFAGCTCS